MHFPEIIHAAYAYVIEETAKFLQEPLISTGLVPHFGLAIDKSTHRETNQAIVLLVPSSGKRVAVPIDAPVVYTVNPIRVTYKEEVMMNWQSKSCRFCLKS